MKKFNIALGILILCISFFTYSCSKNNTRPETNVLAEQGSLNKQQKKVQVQQNTLISSTTTVKSLFGPFASTGQIGYAGYNQFIKVPIICSNPNQFRTYYEARIYDNNGIYRGIKACVIEGYFNSITVAQFQAGAPKPTFMATIYDLNTNVKYQRHVLNGFEVTGALGVSQGLVISPAPPMTPDQASFGSCFKGCYGGVLSGFSGFDWVMCGLAADICVTAIAIDCTAHCTILTPAVVLPLFPSGAGFPSPATDPNNLLHLPITAPGTFVVN